MTLATSLPLQMPSQRESSALGEKKERSSGGAETDSDDVTVVQRVSLDPSLTPTEPQPWTNQSKPPPSTYSQISWAGRPLCLWLNQFLRASLTTALECSDCLLGLQITNGTEWLQIGGRDDTFLPIVIKDSQVSLALFSTIPGGNNL